LASPDHSSGPSPSDAPPPARSPRADRPGLNRLDKRELLVCVCGGIAAYKSAQLVSALVQDGASVTVAMTRNARRFVGRVTFEALSGRRVATSLWRDSTSKGIDHLTLSETADLILVAPATANMIAKAANGLADDLISNLLLAAACPVLIAPAMNTRMWQNAAVRRNVDRLRESGVHLIGPETGWQACRAVGPGRMSEPDAIHAEVKRLLGATQHA